jgi:hypothetical protein
LVIIHTKEANSPAADARSELLKFLNTSELHMRISPHHVVASIFLAVFSLVLASIGGDYSDPASRHGFFYAWFYWLPTRVDLLFMPGGYELMMGLALAVYVAQYAIVLVAINLTLRGMRIVIDFVRPHKHRGGLVRNVRS